MTAINQHSIICDGCGTELVESVSLPTKPVLQLSVIDTKKKPKPNEIKIDLDFGKPLDRNVHFCDFKCLRNWN